MRINYIYRISDAGRAKKKYNDIKNYQCLEQFINIFGKNNLIVIADNCSGQLLLRLERMDLPIVIKKNLGNSGSFLYSIDYAIKNFDNDDFVYFIEDDYWHIHNAKKILIEGLEIGDYVTLYDHPDKYPPYKVNPYVGKLGESSNVIITESTHWKTTTATTCTFATKLSTLKEDYLVWKHITKYTLPYDFMAFTILTKQKNLPLLFNKSYKTLFWKLFFNMKRFYIPRRTLIHPLPGKATHLDIGTISPFFEII